MSEPDYEWQILKFDQPVTFRDGESFSVVYDESGRPVEAVKHPSGETIPFHLEKRDA